MANLALLNFLSPWFWFIVKSYCVVRVLKMLYIIIRAIIVHFFTPEFDLTPLKDSWTVVTGCTDGIGRAYIEELAEVRGIRKFYLIARSSEKLKVVEEELKTAYDCEIRKAVFDFDTDDYANLPSDLTEIDVGILINCVGIAPTLVGNFEELARNLSSKILRVNLMSMVKGWRPLPYLSTYPASKAGISFFSEALAEEFQNTKVRIQVLIPLLVATKLASYEESAAWSNPLFIITARKYAREAVHRIGTLSLTTGCLLHDFQIAFGTLISHWAFMKMFIPTVMLGVHKRRVAEFAQKHKRID